MDNITYSKEEVINGISKQDILNEIEKLNQQVKLIDQKMSVRIDSLILEKYQQLENDITFTNHAMKRFHSQCKNEQIEHSTNFLANVTPYRI